VALWLWAFRMCHADRRPFAIAIFVTAAVAIVYQALGPSVGWWSGLWRSHRRSRCRHWYMPGS
jgi:hypothetical protein